MVEISSKIENGNIQGINQANQVKSFIPSAKACLASQNAPNFDYEIYGSIPKTSVYKKKTSFARDGQPAQLDPQQKEMYDKLTDYIVNNKKDPQNNDKANQEDAQLLEQLMQSGKLLDKDSTGATTLQNLYKIASEKRSFGLQPKRILSETIRTLANPYSINQHFGKMAAAPKQGMTNPEKYDVPNSGTCVAASIEFNLADKKPAEFARYAAGLSSPAMSVQTTVNAKNIAKDKIAAIKMLRGQYNMGKNGKDVQDAGDDNISVRLHPDNNTKFRAWGQNDPICKQPGSRSTLDSLMQSTFMEAGSGNTYNSLNDERAKKAINSEGKEEERDPKGLVDTEKDLVETLVNNKKMTSITYQNVGEDQQLKGYNYKDSNNLVKKHILNALKSGSNVIAGFTHIGPGNKVNGGHEIAITGTKEKNGELYFTYNDTDDDKNTPVEVKADELIPKIHHAGLPENVVDQKELEKLAIKQDNQGNNQADQNNNKQAENKNPANNSNDAGFDKLKEFEQSQKNNQQTQQKTDNSNDAGFDKLKEFEQSQQRKA